MATLREAERARDETAEELRRLGAHAISVEEETEALDAELGTLGAELGTSAATAGTLAAEAEPALGGLPAEVPPGAGPLTVAEPPADLPPVEEPVAERAGDTRRPRRRRSFAVVAWFDGDPPVGLPRDVEIQAGTRTRIVPLRVRRAEQFRAE